MTVESYREVKERLALLDREIDWLPAWRDVAGNYLHKHALTISCDRCGADTGQECTTPTGLPVNNYAACHSARVKPIESKARQDYEDCPDALLRRKLLRRRSEVIAESV